jgi:hypothetical protein
MPNNNNDKELIEYRVTKLEEAVTQLVNSLNVLKEICVRWDNKIGNGDWIGKSLLTDEKLININAEMSEIKEEQKTMKTEIKDLNTVVWKASGALIVLSIVVQLAGPMMIEKIFGHNNAQRIELVDK